MTIYKKSILATIVSAFGGLLMALGVGSIVSGLFLEGLPMLGIGFVMECWSFVINDNKKAKIWKKQMQEKGLEDQIRNSESFAIEMYNLCPNKRVLAYMRTMNPAAADNIARQIAANKANKKK